MSNPLFRILLFFLAGWPGACLYAQLAAIDLPDPALTPQPAMILLGGLSPEVGGEHYRTVFLSTEHPFNPYHHIGLQYTYFLPKPANTYGNRSLEKGGYDLGLYSKFFLHGRLSGRISNLYLSPQLRIGRKNRRFYELYTGGPILY
ncbi:MAG: hypothetical protein ABIO24_03600, partial [Saprospiraceae bacterium]